MKDIKDLQKAFDASQYKIKERQDYLNTSARLRLLVIIATVCFWAIVIYEVAK